MNISTLSIRNPVPAIALFLALVLVGLVSFARMPVTQYPNVDLPVVTISVGLPGAAPAEITSQVVQPIESEVSDIAGMRHVTATASDSAASLTVEFAVGTDTDRALNDVKDAITAARSEMPETITEPVVKRLDFSGAPILTYAVSDPTRSTEDLSTFVDDVIVRDLQTAGGVGSVARLGGATREIAVDLDPDRLLAFGLTAAQVSSQLADVNQDQGGGGGTLAGQDYSIRALGSADSIAALGATPIRLGGGDVIRLDQLGTISDGAQEATSFALFNGRPVVAFGVFRATGASDLDAGENAKARIAALSAQYPDMQIDLVDDATIYTEANFQAAMSTLYEGAILAIIVVFLFLKDWRATVVAFVALPLSAIPTFIVMDMLGFSLNTISLLGITLVVGILVDDAIVEIENIVRHIHMGTPAYQASEEAASEIGMTVIAISLTIVAVFAPVSFMGGIAGQFFKQFGITVAVAVLFSLLVARIITPMFAAYFLKSKAVVEETKDGWLMRRYLGALAWTLRNRTVTLLLGVAIFAGSIFSATLLPTEFIPPSDTGRAVVTVQLPPGTTLAQARSTGAQLNSLIRETPEVQGVFVDGSSATSLNVQVNFGDKSHRDRSSDAIKAELATRLAAIPDVRLFVLDEDAARALSINVLGDTEAQAAEAAAQLMAQMKTLPDLRDVSSDAALMRPEIQITPDPERAAELGVSAATLANAIRITTQGDTDANLAQFSAGEKQVPIRVRIDEQARDDLSRLAGLKVQSSTGSLVALATVADLRLSTGPATLERYDRRYRVAIEADLAEGAILGPATQAVSALPLAQDMPAGTTLQPAGDAETMNEVFSSFALAMGAGILLVYVVLVLLFGSFVTPITILLSLPLAIGGAIFALYLYGAGIGLSVVIGFLMLMGIVTKNAIMLVEFALEAMKGGATRAEAMLDAGHKRARPIIMTTIAMVAGMIPSALAHSTGGEFRAPMAIAVIGGLILSTLLSLLFVPSLFSVLDGLKTRLRWVLGRVLGADTHARPRTGDTHPN
ncbi:Multidrug resistance protein MdtC [Aquimixticola soesokkakensis]|uniref:Multidrug resistance protein MdtC n=1 Tax=Aquimixticola soesokkakensis TaxID=1519096 RepID=A0A1Y5T4Z2_9RHOB|nr:efflux RND transporter permease subunit [Aquimixticola soesokkakensis]SLN55383.1 Multidrug resistance protein MdtC [Aquimixticola soesokkakensis]